MTREEALKEFIGYVTYDIQPSVEATKMAIKALEQESCEDAISRQTVLDYIDRLLNQGTGKKKSFGFIRKYVEKLPSITPQYIDAEIQKMQELEQAEIEKAYELGKAEQPKKGHWIYTLEDWNKWECSECGFTKRTDVHVSIGYKFCPNCGAKMESEVSDEDRLASNDNDYTWAKELVDRVKK